MNTNCTKSLGLLLIALAVPSLAIAQLSVDAIGADPVKEESYGCVRFTQSSNNFIEVTKFGKTGGRSLSPTSAEARATNTLRSANKRAETLAVSEKKLVREIKEASEAILPPTPQDKLNQLRSNLELLQSRISQNQTNVRTLNDLIRNIPQCRKKKQSRLDGSIESVSGTFSGPNGKVGFYYGLYFVIDGWNPSDQDACVKESRYDFVTTYRPIPSDSGACLVENFLEPGFQCIVSAKDKFKGKYYVSVAFASGDQDPGKCKDSPQRCSLTEAIKSADKSISGVTFRYLGATSGGRTCRNAYPI